MLGCINIAKNNTRFVVGTDVIILHTMNIISTLIPEPFPLVGIVACGNLLSVDESLSISSRDYDRDVDSGHMLAL